MPLPKDYYDLINRDRTVDNRDRSSVFTDIADPADAKDPASAYDFLGSALWGAASGLTWGGSELAAPYGKTWEEMSGAERSGWILGEGLSLFTPIGPFGLMAKGSRLVGKQVGKQFVKEAAEKASQESALTKLSTSTAKAVANQSSKIKFST